MAVLLQLQQDAVPVDLQELLRVILGRKTVFFIYFDGYVTSGEKLLLNLLLHRKNRILLYQSLTGQIDPHKVLLLRCRHPLYPGLLKQAFQLAVQF